MAKLPTIKELPLLGFSFQLKKEFTAPYHSCLCNSTNEILLPHYTSHHSNKVVQLIGQGTINKLAFVFVIGAFSSIPRLVHWICWKHSSNLQAKNPNNF